MTARRIEGGADDLFTERHCPCKIYWKNAIWNINIQYKNEWCTLQKWTKPVFSKRHSGNSVTSFFYPSWAKLSIWNNWIHMDWNVSRKLHTILRVRFWSFSCYVKKIKLCVVIHHSTVYITERYSLLIKSLTRRM